MKTLYLECAMGAAGDMLTAALLELTGDRQAFIDKMNALGLPGVSVAAEPAVKCGITGTHVTVTVDGVEEEAGDVHEHEHHHDHDHHGHEHHHHHHHGEGEHDADEVFGNIGLETAQRYEKEEIRSILAKLSDEEEYGRILRAKGILQNAAGEWFQFDYVPGEIDLRDGSADYTGRLCVIGADLNEKALTELFHL